MPYTLSRVGFWAASSLAARQAWRKTLDVMKYSFSARLHMPVPLFESTQAASPAYDTCAERMTKPRNFGAGWLGEHVAVCFRILKYLMEFNALRLMKPSMAGCGAHEPLL
jgi:hypothetical protein